MGISINTNVAATRAGMFLKPITPICKRAWIAYPVARRITEPADDAED